MPIIPRYREGWVCYPAWECPIFWSYRALLYLMILLDTGSIVISMNAIADMDALVIAAAAIGAVVGALIYTLFNILASYHEQTNKAKKIRIAAAGESRDLTEVEALQVQNWEKFDKIFLYEGVFNVLIAAAGAFLCMVWFGGNKLGIGAGDWAGYGVTTFFAGAVLAWVVDNLITSLPAKSEWERKKADAFQAIIDGAEALVGTKDASILDQLTKKFVAAGFTERKAAEMAEQAIINNPSLVDQAETVKVE